MTCLSFSGPYESFADRLHRHTLPGGVLYQVQNVPTVDVANRLMEEVRATWHKRQFFLCASHHIGVIVRSRLISIARK